MISRRMMPIAGVLLAVIAVANIAGLMAPVENAFRAAILPFARSAAASGRRLGDGFRRSLEREALAERNADLEARMDALVVDYVRLRALEEENRSLRALLAFEEKSDYDFVPARVIGRSPDARRVEVQIDKGSRDGLEIGMAVVAEDGLFVGKVTELWPRVSLVTLVSDAESRVAAAAAGRDDVIGVVEGRGSGTAELTLIPQQVALAPNHIIVTAGTEDKVPAHLPIGLVNTVSGRPTDPFKRASVEPLVRIEGLDLVLVLRSTALRPESSS